MYNFVITILEQELKFLLKEKDRILDSIDVNRPRSEKADIPDALKLINEKILELGRAKTKLLNAPERFIKGKAASSLARSKLSYSKVRQARIDKENGMSTKALAKKYRVSWNTMNRVVKYLGYYKDIT